MTPSELRSLTREEALYVVAHELLHRLAHVEPGSFHMDEKGAVIRSVTDEGIFLCDLIHMVNHMRSQA